MKKKKGLIPMNLQLHASEITMDAMDTVNGKMASCFMTVNGQRRKVMELKKFEANSKKNKSTIPILGRMTDGNVARGDAGTWSATVYYVSDFLREVYMKYLEDGIDFYFEIQVTNEDPKTSIGAHSYVFEGCNLDGMTMALIDIESEALEETIEGTYEKARLVKKFNELKGAR